MRDPEPGYPRNVSVQEKERALFAVWDRICAGHGAVRLEALGHSDRVFAAIWMLETELNNGGCGFRKF